MVELPDDAIEAAARAYIEAADEWEAIAGRDSGARTLAEHIGIRVAARVRAEALREGAAPADASQSVGDLRLMVTLADNLDDRVEWLNALCARVRAEAAAGLEDARSEGYEAGHDQGYDEGSELSESQIAAACAEAVAAERQRIADGLVTKWRWCFGRQVVPLEAVESLLAAGSVPVATPQPVGMNAPNGEPLMAIPLPAPSEPIQLAVCDHPWATGPHTYTNAAQWPNPVGHCPGPVAAPTEPAAETCAMHPGLLCDLHDGYCAEPRCEGPCNCGLPRRLAEHSASPVPAVQPQPGTLAYAQRMAEQRGDLADAAEEDGV